MDEIGINVLVEAKLEYTKQLISLLSPRIYVLLKELYTDNCNQDKKYELKNFQLALSEIPSWDQFKVEELTNKILEKVKCEWIDELLTAVFVSNTRILTAVQMKKSNKKLKLEVPKLSIFIHKCFIECARELYKNPYLMLYDDKPEIIHQNMRETFNIIKESINETIRKLLPFKEILKKYLGNPDDTFDDSSSILSEPLVSKPSNKMMRKLLGDEIDEESVYSFTTNEKNLEEDFPEENQSVKSSTDTIVNDEQYETETLNDFKFNEDSIKINQEEEQVVQENAQKEEQVVQENAQEEEQIVQENEKEEEQTQEEEQIVQENAQEEEQTQEEEQVVQENAHEEEQTQEEEQIVQENAEKEEQVVQENVQEEEHIINENVQEEESDEKTIILKPQTKIELTQQNIENLGLNIEENREEQLIENLELKTNVDELNVKNDDLFEIDTFINKSKNKNSKDSIIIPVKRKVVKRKKLNYKNKFLTPDRLTVSNENIKRESSFEDELKNNILFDDLQDEKEHEL